MPFTVLVFKKVAFLGEWERGGPSGYRPLHDEGEMLVVVEGATGTMATYSFVVDARRREEIDVWVYVSNDTNIVYIPAECAKKSPGDQIECGRDG